MKKLITILTVLALLSGSLFSLTAEEIIRKMDQNETFKTAKSTGKIVITDRFGKRASEFIAYSEGLQKSLIEFISIEEEGQKVMRDGEKMYLYFPDAEEVILLQGSALRDGLLGSDISYEDMAGEKDTLKSYDVTLEGSEKVGAVDCHIIKLKAKPKKRVAYDLYKVWVSKADYSVHKADYYSKSGKKIKEMKASNFKQVAGKTVAMKMVMKDLLKKNSATEMIITDIKVNVSLPPKIFSLEELSF